VSDGSKKGLWQGLGKAACSQLLSNDLSKGDVSLSFSTRVSQDLQCLDPHPVIGLSADQLAPLLSFSGSG
jgi:hypothetical protein